MLHSTLAVKMGFKISLRLLNILLYKTAIVKTAIMNSAFFNFIYTNIKKITYKDKRFMLTSALTIKLKNAELIIAAFYNCYLVEENNFFTETLFYCILKVSNFLSLKTICMFN